MEIKEKVSLFYLLQYKYVFILQVSDASSLKSHLYWLARQTQDKQSHTHKMHMNGLVRVLGVCFVMIFIGNIILEMARALQQAAAVTLWWSQQRQRD